MIQHVNMEEKDKLQLIIDEIICWSNYFEKFKQQKHYISQKFQLANYIFKYYIIEKKTSYIEFKVKILAKKTYTSEATINRFCKSLKLDGFSELEYILKLYWKRKDNDERNMW